MKVNMNSNWILTDKDVPISVVLPGDYYGFIYKITDLESGKIYIGRKSFWSRRKRKFGKREIAKMEDKRAKKWEWQVKETDWNNYASSNKELKKKIDNGLQVKREIIKLVRTKEQMTYWETKYQFVYEVLEKDTYNDNILGKFYRKILTT